MYGQPRIFYPNQDTPIPQRAGIYITYMNRLEYDELGLTMLEEAMNRYN